MDRLLAIHLMRRRKAAQRWLSVLVGIVIVAVALIVVLNLSYLRLQHIHIVGAVTLRVDELADFAQIQLDGRRWLVVPHDSIVFLSKRRIGDSLFERYPKIADVEIQRSADRTLVISIKERRAEYVWCAGQKQKEETNVEDRCFYADPDGFVFAEAPLFTGPVFLTLRGALTVENAIGSRFADSDTFVFLKNFTLGLKELSLSPVEIISGSVNNEFVFLLSDGTRVRTTTRFSKERLLSNLDAALGEDAAFAASLRTGKIDYVDMRFSNKIYYRERPANLPNSVIIRR